MNIWVTSDTHFSHGQNALDGNHFLLKQRGFPDSKSMDAALTDIWNETIAPEDTVYHLGDFAWKNPVSYLKNLNGKITLVKGNHDKGQLAHLRKLITVTDYMELKVNKQKYILCHFPLYSWNGSSHNTSIHLHGHSHGKIVLTHDQDKGCFDVGVDTNNFKPYNLDEFLPMFNTWKALQDAV